MNDKKQTSDAKGCLKVLVSYGLAFAAIEGGIVFTSWSLHGILNVKSSPDPMALAWVAAGVLSTFIGPQILFLVNRYRPVITWQQAVAALPDFSLATWFVLGWSAPQLLGERAAGILPGIVVLEFIIIHASMGLVAFPQQIAGEFRKPRWWQTPRAVTCWLLLMYSIFAIGISLAFKTVWLFVSFWLLIGNKFIDDWLSPVDKAEERKGRHMARWGMSAAIYLFLTAGSVFIPVPQLGAFTASEGDGLWDVHPEQAVAMGALYFTLLAFCELYGAFNARVDAVTVSAGRQ